MNDSSPLHANRLSYRPDIDGLRAVAVVSVVLFHAFPKKFPGGFVGVDIFFVISGYLISAIILENLSKNSFSIATFYERRIRRIFPALLTVIASCLAFGWYVLLPNEFQQLARHVVAGTAFSQNFMLWSESGYFDSAAELKPLLHLWSLAIEEQFYIFWPPLLYLIAKRRWNFVRFVAVIFVVSFVANLYLSKNDPIAGYYSPIARFWELMIGGTLAYITLYRPDAIRLNKQLQSVLGLGLLGLGLLLISKDRQFPGWWALLPTAGAFLLISAGPTGIMNRVLLARKPVVWIGLISYPLYLWHWPILSFLRVIEYGKPSAIEKILAVAAAVAASYLTYVLIEKPVRFKLRNAAAPLSAAAVIVLVLGLVSISVPVSPRHNIDTAALLAAGNWDYPGGLKKTESGGIAAYGADGGNQGLTLFIGDSHIEQYGPRVTHLLQEQSPELNSALFITDGGCVPIPDVFEDHAIHKACSKVRQHALDLAASAEVKAVVIGACWNCYFTAASGGDGDDAFQYYYRNGDTRLGFAEAGGTDAAFASLEAMLTRLGKEKPVYLIVDNPANKAYDPKSYIEGNRLGVMQQTPIPEFMPYDDRQKALKARLAGIAERSGATVIDPTLSLCDESRCRVKLENGVPLYMDTNHLRADFIRSSADFIDRTLHSGAP